jgi:LCP family protein required for cell wall assembly
VPSKEKPYRVYRGGRAKGPITPLRPAPHPPEEPPAWGDGGPPPDYPGEPGYPYPPVPPPPARPRRVRRIVLWTSLGVLALALVVVGWGVAGYLSFRGGVEDANRRLPSAASAALTPQEGSLLSSPATILLLGADTGGSRDGSGRADSIVLVRTDPDRHRLALLSIPRDLRVPIPGYGDDKINAAYALGGPELMIETVESLTGLPVNHLAIVDFSSFGEVVDALGGITVDVPKRIISNRFDCPYDTRARCERWQGWQFRAGEQELDGKRALIYARIRENRLDPSESDITRGGRQQQVVQAISDEVVSLNGFLRLPFIGGDVVRPLATDLTTSELLKLGWVKFRASDEATLRCRLGGVAEEIDGVFYISGTEENVAVIGMFTGQTAPQPPPPTGLYAPGCLS